jgi:hypothetical protein
VFAICALLLAGAGLFAVMQATTKRLWEIAIRMAIGAAVAYLGLHAQVVTFGRIGGGNGVISCHAPGAASGSGQSDRDPGPRIAYGNCRLSDLIIAWTRSDGQLWMALMQLTLSTHREVELKGARDKITSAGRRQASQVDS